MSDRKIKFTSDYTVNDLRKGTDEEESYKAGDVVSLNEHSAHYFVAQRNVAVWVDEGESRQPRRPNRAADKKRARQEAKEAALKKAADDEAASKKAEEDRELAELERQEQEELARKNQQQEQQQEQQPSDA